MNTDWIISDCLFTTCVFIHIRCFMSEALILKCDLKTCHNSDTLIKEPGLDLLNLRRVMT